MTNRRFLLNLLGIIVFLSLVIWGVLAWLKVYTHHGQEIELPNFSNIHLTEAREIAKEQSFEIIVNDSVHIVGTPGGIIQSQNPIGGALVKEKRKIYVMISKYTADIVDLSDVKLYGQQYELKKATLERKGLKTKIKAYKDDAAPNVILEMWQGNKKLVSREKNTTGVKLEKGSTVEFVVSTPDGGKVIIPHLLGRTIGAAQFMAPSLNIVVENKEDLTIGEENGAIILSQSPSSNGIATLEAGGQIRVIIQKSEQ